VYNKIGAIYKSIGDDAISLFYLEKTLKIWQMLLPSNHAQLIITYCNTAVAFDGLFRHKKIIKHLAKIVDICRRAFGLDDLRTNEYQNDLDRFKQKL
jgi:hypothetical protein